MLNSIFKSLALASIVALSAGAASSTTVSLQYNGGTAGGGVKITSSPADATPVYSSAGAFGFRMSDVTPSGSVLGNFVAWCLDITHPLGTGGSYLYTLTTTPFDNSYGLDSAQMGRVQSVFDANYASLNVSDNTEAAAFQVALWNSLYDGDLEAGGGVFSISSDGSAYAAIVAKANLYLSAASAFSGPRAWSLTFLESAETGKTYQNLVTATPVPVPAAAGLLLLALGGLGAVGRRRRAA